MNNQVYFCKALGCNGEILFALKHCVFNLSNKATNADQLRFIGHIERLCKIWDLTTFRFEPSLIDYSVKLHNGYNMRVKWSNTLEITITTNDRIVLFYDFQFERELFTHTVLHHRSSEELVELRRNRFKYANDLKNLLMGDLIEHNKTQ